MPGEVSRSYDPEGEYPEDDRDLASPSQVCWYCHGEGGFHDCGEDCCPCDSPELNERCPECDGSGRV